MYRLEEVLLRLVCGSIRSCDDYDDIVLWGETHLDFLRELSPFYWGLPCADWLRVMMSRLDPELFAACFRSLVAERLPGKIDQIAIDGKTSRRSHDRTNGQPALHLVSAYATTHNLVLGQIGVFEKSNEISAIPVLLQYLAQSGALTGALVLIDAMACQSGIAASIVDLGGDYLLAAKDNQKTAHAEIELYFDTAPAGEVDVQEGVEKNHGRLETRRHAVSANFSWMCGKQCYPNEPKFKAIKRVRRRMN